jgi:hypothetical protein
MSACGVSLEAGNAKVVDVDADDVKDAELEV